MSHTDNSDLEPSEVYERGWKAAARVMALDLWLALGREAPDFDREANHSTIAEVWAEECSEVRGMQDYAEWRRNLNKPPATLASFCTVCQEVHGPGQHRIGR